MNGKDYSIAVLLMSTIILSSQYAKAEDDPCDLTTSHQVGDQDDFTLTTLGSEIKSPNENTLFYSAQGKLEEMLSLESSYMFQMASSQGDRKIALSDTLKQLQQKKKDHLANLLSTCETQHSTYCETSENDLRKRLVSGCLASFKSSGYSDENAAQVCRYDSLKDLKFELRYSHGTEEKPHFTFVGTGTFPKTYTKRDADLEHCNKYPKCEVKMFSQSSGSTQRRDFNKSDWSKIATMGQDGSRIEIENELGAGKCHLASLNGAGETHQFAQSIDISRGSTEHTQNAKAQNIGRVQKAEIAESSKMAL